MNAQTIDKITVLEIELDSLLKHKEMFLSALDKTIVNPVLIKHSSDKSEYFHSQREFLENEIKNLLFN